MMSVTAAVAAVLAGRPGRYGVYARNLATGEVVAIDAATVMPAESAVKTTILLHYEREVDAGRVDPTQRLPLGSARFDGSGVLRYLDDGLMPTLDDLAWLMIIVSDNVATAMLVEALGGSGPINETARRLGCPTTRWIGSASLQLVVGGQLVSESSPRDLAELYAHLGERARRILFRQQFQSGLPSLLPHQPYSVDIGVEMPVRVFNKTGLGDRRFVDSALIETDTVSWVVAAVADVTDVALSPSDESPMEVFGLIGAELYHAWATDITRQHATPDPHRTASTGTAPSTRHRGGFEGQSVHATNTPHHHGEGHPLTLSDGVVLLRPWTSADAGFMADASTDPAIQRYNVPAPSSVADALVNIEGIAQRWRSFEVDGDPTGVAFVVVDAASDEPVGMCGVDHWSSTGVAQFGYWLAEGSRGRGLATCSVSLMTRWLFQLAAARVFLTIESQNAASVAVARRAGFTYEGTLRAYGLWQGQRPDVDVYAALPDDWPATKDH